MSNFKQVEINGIAPYDLNAHEPLQQILLGLCSPVIGIRLEWSEAAGYIRNEYGGKTALYKFRLTGQELISWVMLETFVREIKAVGSSVIDREVTAENRKCFGI